MSNCWLLSALQMVLSTPVPGRVGIHGRLPVKSPLSRLWLAPSCVAYSWLVGRTHLGSTVSESYSCFKSALSIIILWHMATSFIFPSRDSDCKVSLQKTLVLPRQEYLTMQQSSPQAAHSQSHNPHWPFYFKKPTLEWKVKVSKQKKKKWQIASLQLIPQPGLCMYKSYKNSLNWKLKEILP